MATSIDKKSAVQILNSRKLVNKEGKFTLKVTSAQPFMRPNKDGGGSTAVSIVNFAAMTAYQLSEAQKHFKAGEYQEATNLNLSASQLAGQYVPSKGEIVDVEIGTIQNNDGVNILVVTSIVPRKAEQAVSISGFSMDEDDNDDTNEISNEDMIKALVEAGEVTAKKAKTLSSAEVSALYAQLEDTLV